jgi:gamma-glutamyltranspeptidase / glutathione hydrolase
MHLAQNWEIRKPSASSHGGIVAAQNGTAAQIGAEVLAAGGTAVDAVVATSLALAVVEPWSSGLGGIGHLVVHSAGADRAESIDFGPTAPTGLDPAAYPLSGETRTELFTWPNAVVGDHNARGPLSFVIPSAVRGYGLAVERFGRMPWRELVAPAAKLARQGLPIDWFTTLKVANAAADLRHFEESRRIWLPNGLPPVGPPDGEMPMLPLGRLAETLERLAEAGPDDFYGGEIARSIAADTRAAGGFLSAEDLGRCQARTVPVLDIAYRGVRFQTTPGMTAGPTLAEVLGRLTASRFYGTPDAAYFEALVDALRAAYAQRLESMGDVETSVGSSTSHITAVDRHGGIAALTTTLLSLFGSHYVLPGTGILMNNGVMWFDPRPGRPNSIGPGKRALTNMCPIVVARHGQAWFGVGASGGRKILSAVLQLASFIVDFGMDLEAAAHHPRIDVSGSDQIGIDQRLSAAIIERLSTHPGARIVEHTVYPSRFACPNLVLRGTDGRNYGISDVMSPWSAAIAEPDPA